MSEAREIVDKYLSNLKDGENEQVNCRVARRGNYLFFQLDSILANLLDTGMCGILKNPTLFRFISVAVWNSTVK